jgi:hypothetical protein
MSAFLSPIFFFWNYVVQLEIYLEIKENLEIEYQKYQKEKIGDRNAHIKNKK